MSIKSAAGGGRDRIPNIPSKIEKITGFDIEIVIVGVIVVEGVIIIFISDTPVYSQI